MNVDRLPPHSNEAEQGTLGCVLVNPAAATESLNTAAEMRVDSSWFYDLRHQRIWQAMQSLHNDQHPVDTITVQQRLNDWNQLEQVGSTPYLDALEASTPSAANLTYYLTILRDKRLARRLLVICAEATEKVYDPGSDSMETRALAVESEIAKLTESQVSATEKSLAAVMEGVRVDMEENHYTRGSAQLRGLPTGKPGNYTDKMLRGIRPDFYVVLAGRPGDGKTSLALNWIDYLALDYVWHRPTGEKGEDGSPVTEEMRGIPIGMFSLEMSEQSLGYRLLFSRARIDTEDWNTGYASKADETHLVTAHGKLSKGRVIIDDAAGQSIAQIAAKARRWVKQYGIQLFVLDYLQLADGDNIRDDDRVRLAKISKKIMALKKQLKVPWLVLCQMNRNIETSESKRTPMLSDLKDCGAIEQDADVVLMLYKPDRKLLNTPPTDKAGNITGPSEQELLDKAQAGVEESRKARRVNLYVAKHRFGPTGVIKLLFQKNLCCFEDWHQFAVKHGVDERNKGERESVVPGPEPEETNDELQD